MTIGIVVNFDYTLGVSAAVAQVPYVAISNAYWCPYTQQKYIVPELPIVRLLGSAMAQLLFNLVRPIAFYHHSRPLNRVRKEHGLPALRGGLSSIYTCADHTVYADIPALFATGELPANHHFIGPILWSPQYPVPPWWGDVPEGTRVSFKSVPPIPPEQIPHAANVRPS